ncbi:MAG TPA: pilus assembly protein [Noviherbaspirillum sp.]|nr:pilus assembly protein [Noviherbaspirillum sp.]
MTPGKHIGGHAHLAGVPCSERGASLIVLLLMLTAVLMLGMSAAYIALHGEKAARNDRDRQIALQAAEAALADAEQDLEHSSRSHIFAQDKSDGFVAGCNGGQIGLYLGLCRRAGDGLAPVWLTVDFLSHDDNVTVPYGRFTGRPFQSGKGMLTARYPRYVIELMSHDLSSKTDEDETKSNSVYFYRITAIGFGMRDSTRVVLQSYYRKNDGANRQAAVPEGRFGWREILNWQELRNARANK